MCTPLDEDMKAIADLINAVEIARRTHDKRPHHYLLDVSQPGTQTDQADLGLLQVQIYTKSPFPSKKM